MRRMVVPTLNEIYDREEERSGLVPLAQSRLFTEIHQNENPFVPTFFLDDKRVQEEEEKGGR